MPTIDFSPAVKQLSATIESIGDEQLANPTPCPAYSLGDLLDHVGGLALAFTAAAEKAAGEAGSQAPSADASRLVPDWRSEIPKRLARMASAWREPEAWTGMTQAGGLDLPGEVAGVVALDELVLHGWDVARASGLPYACDPALLEVVHGFVAQFSGPGQEDQRDGLFGPVVAVAQGAPLLDRVLGLAGRDPDWTPPTS
jgi:uncharacterized protein (TIGR03086 family)